MNTDDETLFREYERQLDEHHKTLELWSIPRAKAIYAVLTIPDAILLVLMLGETPPVMTGGFGQFLKQSEDGVTQALRWLCSEGGTSVKSISDHDLIASAHKYTLFASEYVNIADLHMMYGRGLAEVTIDDANKTVIFNSKPGPGQSNISAWHEQMRDQSHRGMNIALGMNSTDMIRSMEVLASIKYDLFEGRIVLAPLPDDLVTSLGETLLPTRGLEHIPLPAGTELMGFTIDDYWGFIGAVTAWSHAAFRQYCSCVREKMPQCKCMPTQLVDEAVFVEQVSRLGNLDAAKVKAVLNRLTYRPGPKADLLLTPFLCSKNEVAWSPVVVMKTRHERNLLKVMSRGPKDMSDYVATVNGRRDKPLARLIGAEFNKHGYQYKLGEPITAGGEGTDVDVLLWLSAKPAELLIIEAKAILPPDEINEVNDAKKVMLKAQEQVLCAIRILKAMSIEEKQRKFKFVPWERIKNYIGIVLTTDAEPHTQIDPKLVPVISLNTLRSRIRLRDFRSPQRLWQTCVDRPWVRNEIEECEEKHIDVNVGELTYRLPARIVKTKADKVGKSKIQTLIRRTIGG